LQGTQGLQGNQGLQGTQGIPGTSAFKADAATILSPKASDYTNITQQGSYIYWNRTSGDGATWIINQRGLGLGGVNVCDSDTLNTLFNNYLRIQDANIYFDGFSDTLTSQNRGVFWTAYDKETIGDRSDTASIIHTRNVGGLTGSVLQLSSLNDPDDGINFNVPDVNNVRINGSIIVNASNYQNFSSSFPPGTRLLFYQQSAPSGWTKLTTEDNKALRVVSGTTGGTSGGTSTFTSVFGTRSVPLPSHTHGGSTDNTSAFHSHSASGSTQFETQDHGHPISITSGDDSPDHSHNYERTNINNTTKVAGPGSANQGGFTSASGGANARHRHSVTGNSGSRTGPHSHSFSFNTSSENISHGHPFTTGTPIYGGTIGNTMDFAVQYIDVIICTKD
jgi:hypothetical protein